MADEKATTQCASANTSRWGVQNTVVVVGISASVELPVLGHIAIERPAPRDIQSTVEFCFYIWTTHLRMIVLALHLLVHAVEPSIGDDIVAANEDAGR
ncbi:hypothetical protein PT974_09220 [Cladobotryum mycophilum]|uniref:Uncharacterized protein n=1 Tax=Cladobotryum mycophilum TaxID=491253 RepID=A0ABR0SGP7_9HYPO